MIGLVDGQAEEGVGDKLFITRGRISQLLW